MKINITANKTIREIQEEFQQQYPYLKLEFTDIRPQAKIIAANLNLSQTIPPYP
jgi:hypothetical protein